jgi:hypothetical protein
MSQVGFLIPDSTWSYSERYGDHINRIRVKNISFGGSYVISSLLSKRDILEAINSYPEKYAHYVIPREVFDEFKEDIAGNNARDYGLSIFLN